MERITMNIGGGKPRKETFNGRECYVVPTAMIAEGVWPGSSGPLLYRDEELNKSLSTCNHRPIVVYHPKDEEGRHISACSKHVLETRSIGITLESMHDNKLRTESWIDILKANAVDVRIVRKIENGEIIECSTGLYSENVEEPGTFNGKDYVAEAKNIRLDHLAVLPDQLGAYSAADGGGLLQVNAAKTEPERNKTIIERSVSSAVERLGAKLSGNELSYNAITSQLMDLLAGKYGKPGKYWEGMIHDVYTNYAIFCMLDDQSSYSTYKIGYSVKDDAVSLEGDAVQVEKTVEYKEMGSAKSYIGNSAGELVVLTREATMSFDKKAHIDGLIKANVCAEEKRATLEALSDEVLQTLKIPPTPTANTNPGSTTGVADPTTQAVAPVPVKPITLKDFAANGTPQEKAMVDQWFSAYAAQEAALIKEITENAPGVYTAEELKGKPVNELQKLCALAKVNKPAAVAPSFPVPIGGTPLFLGAAGAHADQLPVHANAQMLGEDAAGLDLPIMYDVKEFGNKETKIAGGTAAAVE